MTYTVVITGWAEGEPFEDSATVQACDEDSAFTLARAVIAARYGYQPSDIEIGDVATYQPEVMGTDWNL